MGYFSLGGGAQGLPGGWLTGGGGLWWRLVVAARGVEASIPTLEVLVSSPREDYVCVSRGGSRGGASTLQIYHKPCQIVWPRGSS